MIYKIFKKYLPSEYWYKQSSHSAFIFLHQQPEVKFPHRHFSASTVQHLFPIAGHFVLVHLLHNVIGFFLQNRQ